MKLSKLTFLICIATLTYMNFSFYPKWKKERSEATLSYDVCGYYYYLPTIFIYKDIKKVAFHKSLDEKYSYQGGDFYSALPHPPTGNLVMKYSAGMAVMYAPAFFTAHLLAKPLGYEADGFTRPYQFAISFWSLLIAFLGLWYLRKILLKLNFTEGVVSAVLLTITLLTNYLEYAGISNAQAHNYIFTLYCLMIWSTMRFYETPSVSDALKIGLTMGLAILSRPTEAPIAMIPVLWGVFNVETALTRINFIKTHFSKYLMAAVVVIALGCIQLVYYKMLTGQWIYKSYGKEDWMEWTTPHILDGLFSSRRGWLVYTPIMVFSLIGFYQLWRQKKELFLTLAAFTSIFIYVSFAHNIWWYGGSLGQRQMVQIYPFLAIPLACFLTVVAKNRFRKTLFGVAAAICLYLNAWLLTQAHTDGGMWHDETTQAYLRATIGRWKVPIEVEKLLDNRYDYQGQRRNIKILYTNDFEQDSLAEPLQNIDNQNVIDGKQSAFVDLTDDQTPAYKLTTEQLTIVKNQKWLRALADFKLTLREWDTWKMPLFSIKFWKGNQLIRSNSIRPTRLLKSDNELGRRITLDAKVPKEDFDRVEVEVWNPGSDRRLLMDNLVVESFDEN